MQTHHSSTKLNDAAVHGDDDDFVDKEIQTPTEIQ